MKRFEKTSQFKELNEEEIKSISGGWQLAVASLIIGLAEPAYDFYQGYKSTRK